MDDSSTFRTVNQKDRKLGPFTLELLPPPWTLISRLFGEKKVHVTHSLPKRKNCIDCLTRTFLGLPTFWELRVGLWRLKMSFLPKRSCWPSDKGDYKKYHAHKCDKGYDN